MEQPLSSDGVPRAAPARKWRGALIAFGIAAVVLLLLGWYLGLIPSYSSAAQTRADVYGLVDLQDGTYLILRAFSQYFQSDRSAILFDEKQFRTRVAKHDVFRVVASTGQILWQTAFITESEKRYDHSRYTNDPQVPYHEVQWNPPELSVPGFQLVRRCSADSVQFATVLVQGPPGTRLDDPAVNVSSAQLKMPALQLDMRDGSPTTFTSVQQLCADVVVDQLLAPNCSERKTSAKADDLGVKLKAIPRFPCHIPLEGQESTIPH